MSQKQNTDIIDAEKLLRIVLDNIPMRVFWKDTNSRFLGANTTFLQDLNVTNVEQLVGKSDFDFTHDSEETEAFRRDDHEVMSTGIPKLGIEESQSISDANQRWLRTNKVPFTNDNGEVIGLVGTYEDISDEVKYRKEIEKQALRDSLTGLANRRALQKQIDEFVGNFAGLLFIDLDYFKAVNDSLGHLVGDELLCKVAQTLHGVIAKNNGTVSRLGGDEFGVFVALDNEAQYRITMASIAKQLIDALVQPIQIGDNVVNIGASIGITMMERPDFAYSDAFQKADMAMYVAKDKGRGSYEFYSVALHAKSERKNRMRTELLKGMQNNEFSVVFQPQISTDNKVVGAEILLRWQNPELGSVSPYEFIPMAEETGLIHSLGNWVFEAALDNLLLWQNNNLVSTAFKLAINVSSKQFRNYDIVAFFDKAVAKRGLCAENIQLEITESLLIDQKDSAAQTMLSLQSKGFSIAIDDFGTGYSSLAYIANLPIDKLKIDRSFVSELHSNRVNRKLVDTIINMSINLHLDVLAEGVETTEELTVLKELGCTEFQGYLFSRPLSASQFSEFLEQHQS